jgi:hypothetical protein
MRSRNKGSAGAACRVSKRLIPCFKKFSGRCCFAVISLLALAQYALHAQSLDRPGIAEVSHAAGEGNSSTSSRVSTANLQELHWWVDASDEIATAPGGEGSPSEDRPAPKTAAAMPGSAAVLLVGKRKPPDFNRDIYYRNKLETSVESGYLPINIPFVFDVLINSPYTQWPLKYTLVPSLFSLR